MFMMLWMREGRDGGDRGSGTANGGGEDKLRHGNEFIYVNGCLQYYINQSHDSFTVRSVSILR